LLTVSGGVDSVVMAHLFHAAGYECAIAHCNFQLRGEASEADEALVRSISALLEFPVYVKRFDVEGHILENGGSIQMAARELRYDWFGELLKELGYDAVATAHNRNDSIETFFLNLTRGTGIRGLLGIPPRNGNIVRPLLFATRKTIIQFAADHRIEYREDASNLDTKYTRNKIRHDLVPVLEQINPSFTEVLSMNMEKLREVDLIFRQAVEQQRAGMFRKEVDRITVDISALRSLSPPGTWLFELFSPYGFTRSQCEGIRQMLEANPGRRSVSPTHQLYKDRDRLILVESTRRRMERYYIDSPEQSSSLPFPMDLEILDRKELAAIPADPMTACLDLDLIQFPLTLRHWLHGDYFFPLGMEQMKKVSDFFVDNKVAVPEKERTWILASGRKIVWIVGHRIDHRFRITERTEKVLVLSVQAD